MRDPPEMAPQVLSCDAILFGQLYDRHYGAIRDFCRRRVPVDQVDDAVAETFLTAWRRLDEIPPGERELMWLYRVAYHVVGHQWRSSTRRRRLEERLRSITRREAPAADELVMARDERRLVLDAAMRLGPTDAEVLRLTAWERLSIADIALVLEIEPNAVKQRLHRAVGNLGREYRRLESRRLRTPDAPEGDAS